MKNVILGTTAGALVGAAISMAIPCCDNKMKNNFMRNKKKFIKKSKRAKSQIIKKIAGIIYKVA